MNLCTCEVIFVLLAKPKVKVMAIQTCRFVCGD